MNEWRILTLHPTNYLSSNQTTTIIIIILFFCQEVFHNQSESLRCDLFGKHAYLEGG